MIHARLDHPREALTDIQQAVARGFKDVARMKGDDRIASLRHLVMGSTFLNAPPQPRNMVVTRAMKVLSPAFALLDMREDIAVSKDNVNAEFVLFIRRSRYCFSFLMCP